MKNGQQIKDSVAKFYDTNPQGRLAVLKKLSLIKKIRGQQVLDAGCGAGYFLFDYALAGATVTGIDQSVKSISFIREQCRELNLNPTLIAGDLETVALPDNSFDHIFCSYVLHHTPRPDIVLANFKRWLKPTGEIHLIISNRHGLDYPRRIFMIFFLRFLPFLKYLVPENIRKGIHWEDRFEHPYWNHLTKKEVRRLCDVAGLTIRHLHCGGFTIFITAWLPPILTSLLNKAFGNYLGNAIFVDATVNK